MPEKKQKMEAGKKKAAARWTPLAANVISAAEKDIGSQIARHKKEVLSYVMGAEDRVTTGTSAPAEKEREERI